MGNEDLYKSALADYLHFCIANINKESPRLKCVDIPKDGKTKRRERRQQELKRRKGVRNEQKKADRINQKLVEIL